MKVKYEFATETVDVEVEEIWGEMLMDMDRKEYNNDQSETRRHVSLNEMDQDDNCIPANGDVEDEILRNEEMAELIKAFELLTPEQLRLVKKIYFEGKTNSEIAKEDGVDLSAISHRLKKIHIKLKKNIK